MKGGGSGRVLDAERAGRQRVGRAGRATSLSRGGGGLRRGSLLSFLLPRLSLDAAFPGHAPRPAWRLVLHILTSHTDAGEAAPTPHPLLVSPTVIKSWSTHSYSLHTRLHDPTHAHDHTQILLHVRIRSPPGPHTPEVTAGAHVFPTSAGAP